MPQQGTLAAARRAHDSGELRARDFQIDAFQDFHAMRARVDCLGKAVCLNHGCIMDGLSTFYYGIQMRIVSLFAGLLVLCACGSAPSPTPEPTPDAEREAARSAQPGPARDDRPAIVAFGDSLTAGFGADAGKSYPDFLQQELDRRGLRYRVVNGDRKSTRLKSSHLG